MQRRADHASSSGGRNGNRSSSGSSSLDSHMGELSSPLSNLAPCMFSDVKRPVMSASSLNDPSATMSSGGSSRRRMNQFDQSSLRQRTCQMQSQTRDG